VPISRAKAAIAEACIETAAVPGGLLESPMRDAAFLFAVLVLGSGCGPSEDEFTFDEADMEAFSLGEWSGAWHNMPDSTARFSLNITRPASPDARVSCGTRVFSTS
jgi:hypothetical protein